MTARSLVEHAHSEYNFIFKLGGGDTGFRVGGHELQLTDTCAILVNPWEPHAKLPSTGEPTLALTVLFTPAWLGATLGLARTPRAKLFPQPGVALTPEVQQQMSRVAISMTAGFELSETDREPLLRDLARAVAGAYADETFSRLSLLAERPMDARVIRAVRLLRDLAADNPSLDDIAASVGLSRSRFFEQFKNCVGVSPQQYLDWERMKIATRKLADPGASVAQVSDDLGFSAPSHFARFFSQHIGLPPSDFRRGMLGGAGEPDA
ncbi:helix-turn-helix domain-containing protein [Variovorax sp. RA8]|uniref:helix-turn-helix domain-containing protein n=1 Tax=Variovorax sp. (strain JCM 16519 / RA8) TaxID=662548 RepID=UPI00131611FB|nr:AraC family transcriptional regulator [Variovorax sp. RA8]VTU41682.1 Arabinose operon regulatory protein [Variovorax sp. RA8]